MSGDRLKARLHDTASFLLTHTLFFAIRLAFRPKITYASEKARQEAFREPQVIICDHVRGMDGAVVYSLFRHEKLTALSAKDILDQSPALKRFLSFLPVIEIDRQHPSMTWLRESRRLMREGHHIMIFPEGRCNKARWLRPFKPGCVLLAASAGARILPIWHNGSYHYFFGPRFRMIVGEPYTVTPPPEGLSAEALQRQADELYDIMHDLERQLSGTVSLAPVEKEEA